MEEVNILGWYSWVPPYKLEVSKLWTFFKGTADDYNLRLIKRTAREMVRKSPLWENETTRKIIESFYHEPKLVDKEIKRTTEDLMLKNKLVVAPSDDSFTIGVKCLSGAIERAGIDPLQLNAISFGTESSPLEVGSATPIAGMTYSMLGMPMPVYRYGASPEFACKPGTEAIRLASAVLKEKPDEVKYYAIVGCDTPQAEPGDDLQQSTSDGGGALILSKEEGPISIESSHSANTHFGDFWRIAGSKYPTHEGTGTGIPYFLLTNTVLFDMIEKNKFSKRELESEISYFFHEPNGKFPMNVAMGLCDEYGLDFKKVKERVVSLPVGNMYAGNWFFHFSWAVEHAKPGDKILGISYGSGAGSDGFLIKINEGIEDFKNRMPTVEEQLKTTEDVSVKRYIDFVESPNKEGSELVLAKINGEGSIPVDVCPSCNSIYFGENWDSWKNLRIGERQKKYVGKCVRGILNDETEWRKEKICSSDLERFLFPERGVIESEVLREGEIFSHFNKRNPSPYNVIKSDFKRLVYTDAGKVPRVGSEVVAMASRWRPDNGERIVYMPMYRVVG
jgi:hydroxymethylglutaryl-CoA synthase